MRIEIDKKVWAMCGDEYYKIRIYGSQPTEILKLLEETKKVVESMSVNDDYKGKWMER